MRAAVAFGQIFIQPAFIIVHIVPGYFLLDWLNRLEFVFLKKLIYENHVCCMPFRHKRLSPSKNYIHVI